MSDTSERLRLLRSRHSVRSYSMDPIEPAILNKLKATVTMVNTHEQGMRFQLITDDANPFRSYSRSYGVFENPRNYVAAVVDVATPDAYERAGYFGEQIVMKAVELGLATCFVGGTYDSSSVRAQIRAGEKILFLILFGYPKGKERFASRLMAGLIHLRKKEASSFFEPTDMYASAEKEFPELSVGLEAVACAPSAVNRRPVRLYVGEKEGKRCLCAKVKAATPELLIDLGIAKFNFNYATSTECSWGNGSQLSEV